MVAFSSSLAIAATLVGAVNAASLIVIDPPIISPHAGTVWIVGTQVNVTWDTSVVPPGNTQVGQLDLGHIGADGSHNLDIDNPLATGFELAAGYVTITVPDVPERHTYIVDLFGDSGNISPEFTIRSAF